jgi:hypothetical protein
VVAWSPSYFSLVLGSIDSVCRLVGRLFFLEAASAGRIGGDTSSEIARLRGGSHIKMEY